MSDSKNIETIPAADASMILDWVEAGYFADLDAAKAAYQQYGVLGFLFGDDAGDAVGLKHEPHTPPAITPSGPEFPGAARAYQGTYLPPMARR